MQMTEKGLAEGIAKLDRTLEQRARAGAAAHAAASVTVRGEELDRTKPHVPVVTGELVRSGFVARDSDEAGWGSDHATKVHELDGGRGFKFYQRQLDADAGRMQQRMAELQEPYTDQGVTPASAPCSWPASPASGGGRARAPARRKR
jgi:hypothetical protein